MRIDATIDNTALHNAISNTVTTLKKDIYEAQKDTEQDGLDILKELSSGTEDTSKNKGGRRIRRIINIRTGKLHDSWIAVTRTSYNTIETTFDNKTNYAVYPIAGSSVIEQFKDRHIRILTERLKRSLRRH